MKSSPIEFFFGTGGVGKTTLATSRALYLTTQGLKVLLITIDPAKRLKQILQLQNDEAGEVKTIECQILDKSLEPSFQFKALLINPSTTMERIAKEGSSHEDLNNRIMKTLTRPYGGMNELMAILEVQHHLNQNQYDTIILDTPPGKHFIDFLLSAQKLNRFFDNSLIGLFQYLGKGLKKKKPKKIFSVVVKSGINKLLSYLEKVTGPHFVNDFINTVTHLYENKSSFTQAIEFQKNLKNKDFAHCFLVVSTEQQKLLEAQKVQKEVEQFIPHGMTLILNKALATYLEKWNLEPQNNSLSQLKESMLNKENEIKKLAHEKFKTVLEFSEVLASDPREHVLKLSHHWPKLENSR